ncbi:hypothetical protein [Pseudomonas sp. OA65]|uniref:hypothetical protein n=1 Tax=Pseudomonas sp. OA65 TaxID=2818431 RepID=UPI001A9D7907|nr:hypothetical protein [Pseudomonas sp. OA65]MBO1537120.1 hypothetical protein [Pseudomonas sp. OA65]
MAYGILDTDPTLRCGVLYGAGKNVTAELELELEMWAGQFAKGGFPELPADACDPLA